MNLPHGIDLHGKTEQELQAKWTAIGLSGRAEVLERYSALCGENFEDACYSSLPIHIEKADLQKIIDFLSGHNPDNHLRCTRPLLSSV